MKCPSLPPLSLILKDILRCSATLGSWIGLKDGGGSGKRIKKREREGGRESTKEEARNVRGKEEKENRSTTEKGTWNVCEKARRVKGKGPGKEQRRNDKENTWTRKHKEKTTTKAVSGTGKNIMTSKRREQCNGDMEKNK